MAKSKFKETQRFQNWGVLGLLAVLTLGTTIRLGASIISGAESQSHNIILGGLLLVSLLAILAYFIKVRMKVKVNEKGIKYSIYPWQSNKQKISWEEVKNYEIVDLPQQAALSGWAVQYGMHSRGWNMGSNRGLHLELRNGECYFLSIKNLDELEDTLEEIFEKQAA